VKRGLRHWGVRLLTMLVLIYVGFGAVVGCSQTSIIYPRHMIGAPMPDADIPAFVERWWLDTPDGARVEAWFIPAQGATPERPGPAAIVLHGNAELIDHRVRTAEMYLRMGVSVLLPEYRGYGRSSGTPSQRMITADLLAFYDRLVSRPEVDANRLVYHGVSLGTGYACVLASERPPRALVLNSPFRSVAAMAARFLLPGFLVTSPLRSDLVLATDPAPVLIFHGVYDDIIPVSHGQALAEIAPRAELVELDCGHNDLPPDPVRYAERIRVFLESAGVMTSGDPR